MENDKKIFDGACYLILLGIAIRFIYLFEHSRSSFFAIPILDETYYDLFARTLAHGGDLHPFGGFRPVLYPFFLSVFYRLGGAGGIEISLFVQHALGVATVAIVFLIALRLFGDYRSAMAAGALYALAGVPVFYEGELLIEGPYVFLICLNLYMCARAMRGAARTRAIAWFACGAMTALAAQARANILIFLVFYPVFALYLFMKSRRAAALAASLALAGAFFTLAVFGIVNISQSGRFQLIPNAGGINLYLGNKLTADGMIPKQDRAAPYHDVYRDSAETFAREEYISAMAAEGRKPSDDPLAISDYWTRRAIKEIGKDPVRWAGLMGKKAFFVFWNHEITNNKSFHFFQEKESLVLRILPVGWFLLLALAPLGVISAGKSGDREILFMILCFLALFAVNLVIFFVNSRYRFPMWPMMAVLAGGGLNYFLTAAIKKNWRTLFASLLLILGISIFSLVNWCNATPPSYARDYYFRSLTEYQRGQLSRALDDVRQSLRLDPGDFEASLHLGNVLFALKRYDEAKSAYLNMAERFRPEERVWNNIGVSCEALRDYAGAYRAYGEALKINGADMVALQNMILLEIRGKSFDRAAEKIARLKQLDKDNVVIMCAESFLKKSGGCAGEARMLADKAYKTEPDTAAWIFDLLEKRPVNPEDLK